MRELAEQAGYYIDPDFDIEFEVFAELLVRECVNVLDPNGEYTEKYKHSHTPGPDGLRQVLSQEHYFERSSGSNSPAGQLAHLNLPFSANDHCHKLYF